MIIFISGYVEIIIIFFWFYEIFTARCIHIVLFLPKNWK